MRRGQQRTTGAITPLERMIQSAARSCLQRQLHAQARTVPRARALLCTGVPQTLLTANVKVRVNWLRSAIRRERSRALNGDPQYSLQRHLALHRALLAEINDRATK